MGNASGEDRFNNAYYQTFMYRPNVRCLYPRLENVLSTCSLWLDFDQIHKSELTQKIGHIVGSYHPSIYLPLLYFNTFLGLVGRSPFKCILVNFYINLRHIFVFLDQFVCPLGGFILTIFLIITLYFLLLIYIF